METQTMHACIVCGKETFECEHWFLVAANRWQDKLRILHWNNSLASQVGVQPVCSANHVQELVVHWMTTGSVEYPFAQVTLKPRRHPLRQLLPSSIPSRSGLEIDTVGAQPIGELSVHRESMQRILRECPQSLTSILDALLSALHRNEISAHQESQSEGELCGIGRQV